MFYQNSIELSQDSHYSAFDFKSLLQNISDPYDLNCAIGRTMPPNERDKYRIEIINCGYIKFGKKEFRKERLILLAFVLLKLRFMQFFCYFATMVQQGEITQLLIEANQGNLNSYNKIFPIIYAELRNIAHRIRFQFFGLDTLNTTAIVHEAYLKIINAEGDWESRSHFYGVAAKAMRQVLLNAARRKKTAKRGNAPEHLCIDDWEESIELSDKCSEEILQLEDILKKLEEKDERQVKIVECRFFANMSIDETATVLNISPTTVKRSWQVTKAWLYSQIQHQKSA